MALGTTDISTTLVGNTIGNSSRNVGVLCTSSTINKWSKFKPVKTPWPDANDNWYGLDPTNNWAWVLPSGGSTNPFRLGDFRGYEHDQTLTYLPVYLKSSEVTYNDIYPTGTPVSNTFTFRAFRDSTNTVSIYSQLLPTDAYYYGFKIVTPHNTWYKTFGQVSVLTTAGTTVVLDGTAQIQADQTYAYPQMPWDYGLFQVTLILSSVSIVSGTNNGWSNTTPTGTIYAFPSGTFGGITYTSGGSFTLHDWAIALPANISWDGRNTPMQETKIYTPSGVWTVNNIPIWLTYDIGYYDVTSTWVSTKASGGLNGYTLRLTPQTAISTARSVAIGLVKDTVVVGTVNVSQDAIQADPTVYVYPQNFSATVATGTVAYGSTTLNWSVNPTTANTLVTYVLKKNGTQIASGPFGTLDANVTNSGTLTLATAAAYNDSYQLYLTYN